MSTDTSLRLVIICWAFVAGLEGVRLGGFNIAMAGLAAVVIVLQLLLLAGRS